MSDFSIMKRFDFKSGYHQIGIYQKRYAQENISHYEHLVIYPFYTHYEYIVLPFSLNENMSDIR